MHIKDVEKLKAWLLKKLSPLCDADPSALSKYIVALLRKEKPRSALKELCINQLEVFLSKETPSFVDRLFLSLDTEGYLTGSKENSPSVSPTLSVKTTPIVRPEGVVRGSGTRIVVDHRRTTDDSRHREVDDDDRDFRRTKPRHGSPPTLEGGERGQRKRRVEPDPPKRSIKQRLGPKEDDYRNNRRVYPSRRRSKSRSRSRSRSSTPEFGSSQEGEGAGPGRKRSHGDQQMKPNKRQRCKDYDEKGMCLLGEQCPFDHGVDPVVITGPLHPPPYPPPPHFPMGMPPPPNTTNGLMLPPNIIPPPPMPVVTSSSVDGYNPEEPSLNAPSKILAPPPPMIPSMMTMTPNFPSMPGLSGMGIPRLAPPTVAPSNHPGGIAVPKQSMMGKPHFRLSDTLVLRKVPRELNTITKLSGHFEKFGSIVNLQVRYENDPESAIVQFSTPQDAKRAHNATEAVLNNRFIKVYYLKNTGMSPFNTGSGQKENVMGTSISPEELAVQSIRPDTIHQTNSLPNSTTQTTPTSTHTQPNSTTQHRHHQQPQELSIHEKKQLIKQEAVQTAAEKRMELQKKSQSLLEAQIKQQKLLLSKLEKSGSNLSTEEKVKVVETLKSLSSSILKFKETLASATKTAQVKPILHPSAPPRHAPQAPLDSNNSSLQQTADQLRNEARQLGILPKTSALSSDGGGDLRSKLESKPRQLLVINSVTDKDLLVKYFESFGGLNQVEIDPDCNRNLVFTFRNRTIAEKAVQGSIFKGKPLIMKWYNPKPKSPPPPLTDPPPIKRIVTINNDSNSTLQEKKRPTSISKEIDADGLLDGPAHSDTPIDVLTPNQSKPSAIHLLDDEEEDEDRSWRR